MNIVAPRHPGDLPLHPRTVSSAERASRGALRGLGRQASASTPFVGWSPAMRSAPPIWSQLNFEAQTLRCNSARCSSDTGIGPKRGPQFAPIPTSRKRLCQKGVGIGLP